MTTLRLHNTLTNQREDFVPRIAGAPTMYVCGPTVYGPVHVGNARPAVVFDVLYRLLQQIYGNARFARNITDIDDKIIQTAAAEGIAPATLAVRWRRQYHDDMHKLGVLPPTDEPMATDYIPQMTAMIEQLLANGAAYVAEQHVLFHVPSFSDYGALSNRRRADMIDGARVEVAPYKRDAADFVLWKPAADEEPGWQSPWGRGRPGWHVECSAMAAACLGEEIDIHGGGQDLIFPHHENELAQSRCAHRTPTFARFWLHNGHVQMDGEKMSKSLANVRDLRDLLAEHHGETVRLALLGTHYRRPLTWTAALLGEARATLSRWYRALAGDCEAAPAPPAVTEALADDLNTPAAITALHQIAAAILRDEGAAAAVPLRGALAAGAALLGVLSGSASDWFHATADKAPAADVVDALIAERTAARTRRDFAAADAIRLQLEEQGIVLEDNAGGTTWRSK